PPDSPVDVAKSHGFDHSDRVKSRFRRSDGSNVLAPSWSMYALVQPTADSGKDPSLFGRSSRSYPRERDKLSTVSIKSFLAVSAAYISKASINAATLAATSESPFP